jgi:hypothetical protein
MSDVAKVSQEFDDYWFFAFHEAETMPILNQVYDRLVGTQVKLTDGRAATIKSWSAERGPRLKEGRAWLAVVLDDDASKSLEVEITLDIFGSWGLPSDELWGCWGPYPWPWRMKHNKDGNGNSSKEVAMSSSAQRAEEYQYQWSDFAPVAVGHLKHELESNEIVFNRILKELDNVSTMSSADLDLLVNVETELSKLAMRAADLGVKIRKAREGTES